MDNLLRTLLVDDLRVMLGLLAVLPNKINDQLSIVVFLTSVYPLNLILPRPRGGTPFLRCRKQRLIGNMRLVLSQSLGPYAESAICRPYTPFGLGRYG